VKVPASYLPLRGINKKMKKTIAIIFGIVLLSSISAMYSGETFEKVFDYPIINCSIENNTYNLEGLNLTWEDKTAVIETQINYKPDNFTLVCWVNESHYYSTGGSHHYEKEEEVLKSNITYWVCEMFPECIEGETVSRYCFAEGISKTEYKFCGITKDVVNNTPEDNEEITASNFIFYLIFGITILSLLIIFFFRSRE
jgi:hypothetical protein